MNPTIVQRPAECRARFSADWRPFTMGKRPAESGGGGLDPLKRGERPKEHADADDVGAFEDEFNDEYESEDDIIEAGVDGRPDDEREAEEQKGMWACLCRATAAVRRPDAWRRTTADADAGVQTP